MGLIDNSNFNSINNMITLTLDQNWAKNNNSYSQEQKNNKRVEELISTFVKMDTEHQEIVLSQLNKLRAMVH